MIGIMRGLGLAWRGNFESEDAGWVGRVDGFVDGAEGAGGVVNCCVFADDLGGEAWCMRGEDAVDFRGDGDGEWVGILGACAG